MSDEKPKITELTKYRVSLPLKKGLYVAATSPKAAVQACFPDSTFERKKDGPRWVWFDSDQELPEKWPKETEGGGGGTVVDVEEHGTILVARDDEQD